MAYSRLRWQCRRGMQELDVLLLRYLENVWPDAPPREKAAFEALLALPDPELLGYLLYRQPPESPAIAHIVHKLLGDA